MDCKKIVMLAMTTTGIDKTIATILIALANLNEPSKPLVIDPS